MKKVLSCPECGMRYVPEVPEDFKKHKIFHDEVVNGLPAPPLNSDKTIWTYEDLRITVVSQLSPIAQRRRAEEVARLANYNSGFDFPAYSANEDTGQTNTHIFLLCKGNRGIGLLVVQSLDNIWKSSWDKWRTGVSPKKIIKYHSMWSICMVWVLKRYRHVGHAKKIIEEFKTYVECCERFGWYTPFTDSGEALARKINPTKFFIVK